MINEFNKYQHIERIGTQTTEGLLIGKCYVFPKLDGTNASIWNKGGELAAGSRNRELSFGRDNQEFFATVSKDLRYLSLVRQHPDWVFYGEWLVPHTLKTYREDAWKKFYIFDIIDFSNAENPEYIHYDIYSEILKGYDIPYIPCTTIITNPDYGILQKKLQSNTYLIKEGNGFGEGIVIKRYDFVNNYGNIVWGKLVSNTFKGEHAKVMGGDVIVNNILEEAIVEDLVTQHSINKVISKIINREGLDINFGLPSKYIAELLGTCYYELITEELWNAIKKYKNPRIDFKTLNHCTINKIKQLMPELFR